MITIKDVATISGVSVGTVSKVLNNQYVKPANKEMVERAIQELGYQVNTYARGLKAQQTYTVAMIIPDLINPFFAMLVNYVEQALSNKGYKLLLCNSHGDEDLELSYINMTKQNKVDGIIALTYSDTNDYFNCDIPVVSIDRHFNSSICCVSSDNEMGGWLAARQFVQTNCKNVIYIRSGSSLEGETLKRGSSFLEYCKQHNLQATQMDFGEQTTLTDDNFKQIFSFLQNSLKNNKFIYDGIFTSSDVHAIMIVKQLKKMGLSIPDDVQIIGYDGLKILNVGDYLVSSIEQPVEDMAFTCVKTLIDLINQKQVSSKIILPVKFIAGGTTK